MQIDDSETISVFTIDCLKHNYDVHALFIILQEQIEDIWPQTITSIVCTCVSCFWSNMEQWQKVPAGQWKHCEVKRRLILENALRRFTEKVLFNTGF